MVARGKQELISVLKGCKYNEVARFVVNHCVKLQNCSLIKHSVHFEYRALAGLVTKIQKGYEKTSFSFFNFPIREKNYKSYRNI